MKFLVAALSLAVVSANVDVRPSGLTVETLFKPDSCEKEAASGNILTMHYTGTLLNGKKFDSSLDRSEPFKFQIGVGQVIRGWDEGVVGMCVGEKRKLTVPSDLGYGQQGAGDIIPGDATLIFDIELLDVEAGPQPVNVFKQIDADADAHISRDELAEYLKQQVAEMQSSGSEHAQEAEKMMREQDKLVEEIFSHEDKDRDGYISHIEFSGPKHDEL